MSSWSSGYVSEITYIYGYYREMLPQILKLQSLLSGRKFPSGKLHYCELGCGHGVTSNIMAAANPEIEFYANDFNPTQINGARDIAQKAKTSNVRFYEASFQDFADEPSLPEKFEIIALHGIFSWINHDNQEAIIDFINKKLATGGIVYISYNTYPGWAGKEPMRQLLYDHANTAGNGTILERLNNALTFAQNFTKDSAYFQQNQSVIKQLEELGSKNPNYIAHEYLNDEFHPFYFRDIVSRLSEVKLEYLGTAHILDYIDVMNLTADQRKFLESEPDPIKREWLRDYAVNQQFRRDVYGKGVLSHSGISAQQEWQEMRFCLNKPRSEVPMKAKGILGEADLQEAVYGPLLDALSNGPIELSKIIQSNAAISQLSWQQLLQALAVLIGVNHVEPCLELQGEKERKRQTQRYNTVICELAMDDDSINYLASPVTGGAVVVPRIQQLFLQAMKGGKKLPKDWAASTWQILNQRDQKVVVDGKALDTDEANLNELLRQAEEFEKNRLPVLKHLGIV